MCRRGLLSSALVVAVLAAGCSGEEGPAAPTGTVGDEVADVAMDPLDCEELGFPCSWEETSLEARERTGELLAEAGLALDAGRAPGDVAGDLAGQDGVVAVLADPTGVQLRVEGAPPVVAWTPMTLPLASALDLMANWDERRQNYPGLEDVLGSGVREEAGGLVAAQGGDIVPYEPTRDADIRPRSALLVRPWEAMDAETIYGQLQRSGQLPPGATPETLNVDNVGLGTTVRLLEESPHITLVRATSDAAFSEFGQYDLVDVQTHSATFGPNKGCDPTRGHVCGEVLGGYPLAEYDDDAASPFREIAFEDTGRLPPGATVGYMLGYWTVGYTPDFFRQAYPAGSLDAIVILNACGSAGASDIGQNVLVGLASTGNSSRGPAVFGWTDYMNAVVGDVTTAVLADLLLYHGVSTHMAIEAIGAVPELRQHVVQGEPDDHNPRLVMAGRDMRARDAVTVLQDGFDMEPGAVLVVEGTPEDGVDDRIKELVLRVDGVPDEQREGATLTWRLPARHAQPIEIEDPFTARSGLQVREVNPEQPFAAQGEVPVDWRSYELTLTDLDLEFDVTREELQRDYGHELVVEVTAGNGEPSRHSIEPVYLRQAIVEVLDPEFGQPLEEGERVVVDGQVGDGRPESYPLVVSLDQMDEALVPGLVLEVDVGGVRLTVPGTRWQRVEEGRYRVDRPLELFDLPENEFEVPVRAWVDIPELGTVDFEVDPVVLVVGASGCARLLNVNVSVEMGRDFSGPVDLGAEAFFLEGVCRYEAPRSYIDVSLVDDPGQVASLRQQVEDGADTAVDGFGDAALYDLTSGNALNPSSIEVDGEPQYSNFVNLVAVIDDGTMATVHVQGNIVIEEGPESGLLVRLRGLVQALRANT